MSTFFGIKSSSRNPFLSQSHLDSNQISKSKKLSYHLLINGGRLECRMAKTSPAKTSPAKTSRLKRRRLKCRRLKRH